MRISCSTVYGPADAAGADDWDDASAEEVDDEEYDDEDAGAEVGNVDDEGKYEAPSGLVITAAAACASSSFTNRVYSSQKSDEGGDSPASSSSVSEIEEMAGAVLQWA
jgi:hypothetical protein